MSWLNQVLSTPAIGLQIEPDFELFFDSRKIIGPLLNQIYSKDLEFKESGNGIEFFSKTGYKFSINLENLVVEFNYRLRFENYPGHFPTLKTSDLEPYTNLFEECIKNIELLIKSILIKDYKIKLKRIGVMARTNLTPNDLPPCVQQLYDYLASPWRKGLMNCNCMLLGKLEESEKCIDRCHYILSIDNSVKMPQMDFILDWQRLFSKIIVIENLDQLKKILFSTCEDAKEHFEKIGKEGML